MATCRITWAQTASSYLSWWATPTIISATMQSGPLMGLVVIVCIAVTALLYLPFFKVADQQAYEEEQAIAASKSAE